jgi:hypothetical protein
MRSAHVVVVCYDTRLPGVLCMQQHRTGSATTHDQSHAAALARTHAPGGAARARAAAAAAVLAPLIVG